MTTNLTYADALVGRARKDEVVGSNRQTPHGPPVAHIGAHAVVLVRYHVHLCPLKLGNRGQWSCVSVRREVQCLCGMRQHTIQSAHAGVERVDLGTQVGQGGRPCLDGCEHLVQLALQ